MEITDIRIKLVTDPNDRLKAVCSVTFDEEFVVRDLKVVEGTSGLFVAMPSRKLSTHCPECGGKNHIKAVYCNECGKKLPPPRGGTDANGRLRLHRDVAHPINPAFREKLQQQIIERFGQERELAADPDYKPADIDAEFEESAEAAATATAPTVASPPPRKPAAAPAKREKAEGGYDFTDYDALIAGLRSGGRPAPEREPESAPRSVERQSVPYAERQPSGKESAPKPAPRAQPPRRGDRGGRPSAPRPAPQPVSRTNTPAPMRQAPEPAERIPERMPARVASPPPPREEFGRMEPSESRQPQKVERVAEKVERAPDVADEPGDAFGAGIL